MLDLRMRRFNQLALCLRWQVQLFFSASQLDLELPDLLIQLRLECFLVVLSLVTSC